MTTANQLRDALTAEAGGLPDATPAWDDIARRGRHRQRARRVQAVAAIAVLAGVAATTLALATSRWRRGQRMILRPRFRTTESTLRSCFRGTWSLASHPKVKASAGPLAGG